MFCIPVITYAASCLEWTEEELRTIDINTRKEITKHGTLRLMFLEKKEGEGF